MSCTCDDCKSPTYRVDRELVGHSKAIRAAMAAADPEAVGGALDKLIAWALPLLAGVELDPEARRDLAVHVRHLWETGSSAGTWRA